LQRKADYQKTSNQLYQIILYKTREKLDKAKEICRNIDSEVLKLLNKLKYEAKISYESIFKNIQEKLFETRYNLLDLKYIFLNLENQIFNKQNLVKDTYLNIKRKVKQDLEAKKYQLELDYSKIQAFDVQKILDKGFAIVWQNGEILDSYKKYKKSKDLRIQFRDGNLEIIRE
jgi:exonuclease VII large subunit